MSKQQIPALPGRRRLLVGAAALLGLPGLAGLSRPAAAAPVPRLRPLPLPPRSEGAETGSAFAARTAGEPDAVRYAEAVDQLLQGNLPLHLRLFTPVRLAAPPGHLGARRAVIQVSSDYLALGSDEDFLRVPLDLHGARALAHATGCLLPTPRMVDAIYLEAATRLTPCPLPPTREMRTMAWIWKHHELIAEERGSSPLVPLVAGHKKDVVLTGRLHRQPDRVAIYGWHRPSGEPIQPLSLVHGAAYADYSHGVRLVHPVVRVDGVERSLVEALADPWVAPLLTREGVISAADRLLGIG